MLAYLETPPQRRDAAAVDRRVATFIDPGRNHRDVPLGHVVHLLEQLHLLVGRGDHVVAASEDEELLADPLLESVEGLELVGVTVHPLALPRTQRVRGVHVGNAEFLAEALTSPSGIPVVRVDHVVADAAFPYCRRHRQDEVLDVVVHVLFADEVGPSERDAPNPEPGAHVVELGLVFEPAGDNVDPIPDVGELLGEFEHEDDLASGIGSPQLGLACHISVCGQHQDGACVTSGLHAHLPSRADAGS